VQHRAVNACLCPLYAVEGIHVVTVEGEFVSMARVFVQYPILLFGYGSSSSSSSTGRSTPACARCMQWRACTWSQWRVSVSQWLGSF
jgi:hypothetical protein